MTVSTKFLPLLLKAIRSEIEQNVDEVTALDQAIGDGDHVTNLIRGLDAVGKLEDELVNLDWSAALLKIGMTLMSTMGGASGSLYGSLFLAMSKASKDRGMSTENLALIFEAGVDSVKQRGKAELGEKTMLDTLIPASAALNQAVAEEQDLVTPLENLKQAATTGMLATKDMLATKGRASFLGERARGHIDAGARTSQLIICTVADELLKKA